MTHSGGRSTTELDVDEVRAGLERLLADPAFAGSPQLSRFLQYVVNKGLEGTASHLKESVIGVAVFHRGAGYDPKTDPVVRVEARRLRARLSLYYEGTGFADPVRIGLPKGGYVPVFERPQTAPIEAEAVVPMPEPEATGRRLPFRWLLAAGLLVLVTALAYLALRPDRVVSRFWASLLQGERATLLIPADSALVILENLAHQPVTLSEYMSGEYRGLLSSRSKFEPDLLYQLAGRRYTSIADLQFASAVAQRPEAARRGLMTRYARDVRVEDLKGRNVMLLGARMSNPWVEIFEKDATFRLDDDSQTGAMRIVNLTPMAGETREIPKSTAEIQNEIYGIITYHRNQQDGTAGLVVAGMTVAGTEAAGDFLMDDSRLRPWLERARSGAEIRGFDILLRGRNLSGSTPRAEVISFHVQK